MRTIINLGVLATLIVVAIALTFLIVDQHPTQVQAPSNLPTLSVDTWISEVALFQEDDDDGDDDGEKDGDDDGEKDGDDDGDDDGGIRCIPTGEECTPGAGECCGLCEDDRGSSTGGRCQPADQGPAPQQSD